MVLLVEEEVVAEAVVEAMVFGSDTMKVYLRKQSFPTMAEEQNKRLRERERGSGESCERMNEMNSNYISY